MADLEILYFQELKNRIQERYLEDHNPSDEEISNWKGIDIIYFQEDLRKKTKGNISEKSFYTYFKNDPVTKIPRIDILNLLSIYVGFDSWFDFKKKSTIELPENGKSNLETNADIEESLISENETNPSKKELVSDTNEVLIDTKKPIIQKTNVENQSIRQNQEFKPETVISNDLSFSQRVKKYLWLGMSSVLAVIVGLLAFQDRLFSKEFTYTFIDADRNSKINDELSVQILKENESPIMFKVKPNSPFVYTTKSKTLKMVVHSPFYKTDTIFRNLETAPENENLELKPDDYAFMLYFYSNPKTIPDVKKKRENLHLLISDQALIYQVYDNETYGVETLNKSRYINLVTTPTTSLKNLEVIDTQIKNGKIVLIKFRISSDENN